VPAESPPLKILLVSPDLMATSRLAGLCREAGASLETLRSLGDAPHGGPHDVVLLDLQALAESSEFAIPVDDPAHDPQVRQRALEPLHITVAAKGPCIHQQGGEVNPPAQEQTQPLYPI